MKEEEVKKVRLVDIATEICDFIEKGGMTGKERLFCVEDLKYIGALSSIRSALHKLLVDGVIDVYETPRGQKNIYGKPEEIEKFKREVLRDEIQED